MARLTDNEDPGMGLDEDELDEDAAGADFEDEDQLLLLQGDEDDGDDIDDDDEPSQQQAGASSAPASKSSSSSGGDLKCTACDFTTRSRLTLQRHERVTHLKKKFFRCVKCNYVTHVKARYTKHVKYHSMPMIKCDLCEFRTPYKWNLDRHLKNHMGGGMYQCSLCNFTAHIKQSLTVHIQNHHLSPEKARSARRRNKVGASDQLNQLADAADAADASGNKGLLPAAVAPSSSSLEADEMELLRLERMAEHDEEAEEVPPFQHRPTSSSSKGNKIKIPQGPARGIKCHLCPFRTASDSELARHLSKDHPPKLPQQQPIAAKRPVPNLIPISPPSSAAPTKTILKIPQLSAPSYDEEEDDSAILEAVGLSPAKPAAAAAAKKTGGFLNQLAEKLASSKQSIVNSEPVAVPTAAVGWSSRCQHCRQRCKTRADLLSHLKLCPMAIEASQQQQQQQQQKQEPHPMENKVFVWNDAVGSGGSIGNEAADAMMMMMMMQEEEQVMLQQLRQQQQQQLGVQGGIRPSSVAGSDISEASLMGVETAPGIGAVTGGAGATPTPATTPTSAVRRVYRCPQCSFWATTASRFHVHMVGHTNTKPFECSQCAYRSNWRWDITKHIKLKAARDPEHVHARVLLLDASGERHYDQYDRYLVMMRVTESPGGPSLTHGRLAAADEPSSPSPSPSPPVVPSPLPPSTIEPFNLSTTTLRQPPALHAIGIPQQQEVPVSTANFQPRRTIWKCKRCTFKDHNREAVLQHIRSAHYQQELQQQSNGSGGSSSSSSSTSSSKLMTLSGGLVMANGNADLLPPPLAVTASSSAPAAFRCGVCHQVSNWKHVIQRHCRLKHNGNIQVIENRVTDEDGPELSREGIADFPPPTKRIKISSNNNTSPISTDRHLIDEDSMGYMMHPDKQQYSCSTCPFICKSLTDIETHRMNHKSSISRPFKCTICPYYVSCKQELAQHILLHHSLEGETVDEQMEADEEEELLLLQMQSASSGGLKRFRCSHCPYVSDSKSQYVYHKQFHRARGAPYRCPQCSYNVSRRHLLNQHLKVHGLPPVRGDEDASALTQLMMGGGASSHQVDLPSEDGEDDHQHEEGEDEEEATTVTASPTVQQHQQQQQQPTDGYTHLGIDPDRIQAKLADSATVSLPDIPLTWVSRGLKFFKMFKCRFCPHVNVRKANIQEHEKRHQSSSATESSMPHACTICNYRCNNAGVLSAHVKVHSNVLGIVHALADSSRPDEEQLRSLAGLSPSPPAGDDSTSSSSSIAAGALQPKLELLLGRSKSPSAEEEQQEENKKKMLHFCDHCPARFLVEAELIIHQRFHGLKLAHSCDVCTYTARQENHLLAHWKVHSPEYQERTKVLVELHGVSEKHPQPRILAVQAGGDPLAEESEDDDLIIEDYVLQQPEDGQEEEEEEEGAMDLTNKTTDGDAIITCPLCPARFERESKALLYHTTLHGSDAPFRCRHCNYAVKAKVNLTKHEKLHKVHHTATTSSTKVFECVKCPTTFEKKEQLKAHVNLHGSRQRYQCDRCDYAAKHHANYLQHVKKHDEHELLHSAQSKAPPPPASSLSINGRGEGDRPVSSSSSSATPTMADRQHLWLQDKLIRSPSKQQQHSGFGLLMEPMNVLSCQYCPFRCRTTEQLSAHTANHAVVNGRSSTAGGYRCNFCDYTAPEQHHLPDHIRLHFQLKSTGAGSDGSSSIVPASSSPDSYWKCSNLEIWSEPVIVTASTDADNDEEQQNKKKKMVVYEENNSSNSIKKGGIKTNNSQDDEEEEDEDDALYIDLSTGQPIHDDDSVVALASAAADP